MWTIVSSLNNLPEMLNYFQILFIIKSPSQSPLQQRKRQWRWQVLARLVYCKQMITEEITMLSVMQRTRKKTTTSAIFRGMSIGMIMLKQMGDAFHCVNHIQTTYRYLWSIILNLIACRARLCFDLADLAMLLFLCVSHKSNT